jgi:hypothetical protein
MRETRSSGSVEGVMSNLDPYSDYSAAFVQSCAGWEMNLRLVVKFVNIRGMFFV